MTLKELEEAIAEAERFLDRARKLKQAMLANPSPYHPGCFQVPQAENAAMKRASLDLSMALPPLRKGR